MPRKKEPSPSPQEEPVTPARFRRVLGRVLEESGRRETSLILEYRPRVARVLGVALRATERSLDIVAPIAVTPAHRVETAIIDDEDGLSFGLTQDLSEEEMIRLGRTVWRADVVDAASYIDSYGIRHPKRSPLLFNYSVWGRLQDGHGFQAEMDHHHFSLPRAFRALEERRYRFMTPQEVAAQNMRSFFSHRR